MRKLKKSFTVFMACLMTAVMLCSSGCVIIVSDKWIEKGVETVKEIELKRFAMKFYKAGLVYGKMDDIMLMKPVTAKLQAFILVRKFVRFNIFNDAL